MTRFAPSPTGYLHLGHVVNALYTWGIARGIGGKVILRLEDHDQTRFRPPYEAAILEDLEWLGLIPDQGSFAEFRAGPCQFRQSDREEQYRVLADLLHAQGLLYACSCSRKDLRSRHPELSGEIPYDGHCREKSLPLDDNHAWRLQLPTQSVQFHDLLAGQQEQTPATQCGDVVIRDRNANWTYQFAVVADDIDQGVNLIIRGTDILESTGRQKLIAQALGHELNVCYAHHGLLMGPNGVKLSKKHFDKDIHQRKLAGETAEEILGEAAQMAGLITHKRPISVEELPDLVLF